MEKVDLNLKEVIWVWIVNFEENSHLLNTDPDGATSMPLKENISSKRQSKLTPKALEYKLEENNHRFTKHAKNVKTNMQKLMRIIVTTKEVETFAFAAASGVATQLAALGFLQEMPPLTPS